MEFSIPIAFNLKSTVSTGLSFHILLYNTSFMFFFNGIEISGYVFHCSGNTFMSKKFTNINNSFLNISHIIYYLHLFFNNFNLCIYYTYKVNVCQLCVIKNSEKLILSS